MKCEEAAPRIERWSLYAVILLALYATIRAAFAASLRPFWLDEIWTWIMAHQPNAETIWIELRHGVDPQSFLFYFIERNVASLPHSEIALRLPSIIAFPCVMVCIFAFVRRQSSGLYGLISASILMLTSLYFRYAVEARPYCLVSACIAIALVAYQRASSPRWTVVLCASLTLAECLHYYSIFALASFAAAELVLSWQMSKVRLRIWISLAIGAFPLVIFWTNLIQFRIHFGSDFLAQATLPVFVQCYADFLNTPFYFGLPVAIVCGLAVLWDFFRDSIDESILDSCKSTAGKSGKLLNERILLVTLLTTPLISLAFAKLMNAGYSGRYVLFTVLGIPSAVGLVLPSLGRRTSYIFCALLMCSIMVQEASFWWSPLRHSWRQSSPTAELEQTLRHTGHPELPVVVTDWLEYSVLSHYASPGLAARLQFTNGPTEDDQIQVPVYFPFRIFSFQQLQTSNQSFLLYTNQGFPGWWVGALAQNGFHLQPLASVPDHVLFLAYRSEGRAP